MCINDLLAELDFLDKREGSGLLSNAEREKRNNLKLELASKLHLETIYHGGKNLEKDGSGMAIELQNISTAQLITEEDATLWKNFKLMGAVYKKTMP